MIIIDISLMKSISYSMTVFKMATSVLTLLRVLRNTRQSGYGTFNLTISPILRKRAYSEQTVEPTNPKTSFKRKLKTGIWITVISGIILSLGSQVGSDHVSVNGLPTNSNFRKRFNFIADIVKHTSKSVVLITVFRFDNFLVQSNGSGFIVSSDGLILTNAHVIGSKKGHVVQVRLSNGKVFDGIVLDIDLYCDLAAVKIKSTNLPVLPLGKSNDLQPGEWVAAIGNPLTLVNSVTAGVVSSVYRSASELGLEQKNMQYIQTDAAITSGNSGGPLVNLDGEVVGVNAMTVFPGISFAVPVEYAKKFLMRIKMNKEQAVVSTVKTNYNGMSIIHLSPQVLAELRSKQANIPNFVKDGLLIWNVQENSPAHKIGLVQGDIIHKVDENENGSTMLHDLHTKDSMVLTIIRNGQKYKVKIVPEKMF